MKKIHVVTLVVALTLFASRCSEVSPRQKCYEDNYCKSADSDCLAASLLISSLLEGGSKNSSGSATSSRSSNSLLSTLFNPLLCVGSKATCEADCDKKHPF
ncbi:LA_0364 family Cys-rich lipoprotein [Leptospira alstonii]|uniref:LA_0364 family Cys-rich lipoprotein n=1 Tax=Leptospira alstonii TaxID=28452 RepID=UPI0009DA1D56|nr:hypothetical protein [Leptospira alstonii]